MNDSTRTTIASAATPEVSAEAVRELYDDLAEAHEDGCSSNDVAQIVDDWFVRVGFPTILYRTT